MNTVERQGIGMATLDAFGEDYHSMGLLVHHLRLRVPGEDWEANLTALASSYQPFIDSGLSIDWWVQTVIALADDMG